jgi:hypothetical protein
MVCRAVPLWEIPAEQGIPPTPRKALTGAGFCKKCLQNLEPKGFRGQNLDTKGLAAFFMVAACTASALTIFCSLPVERKVRCHTTGARAVDFGDCEQTPGLHLLNGGDFRFVPRLSAVQKFRLTLVAYPVSLPLLSSLQIAVRSEGGRIATDTLCLVDDLVCRCISDTAPARCLRGHGNFGA